MQLAGGNSGPPLTNTASHPFIVREGFQPVQEPAMPTTVTGAPAAQAMPEVVASRAIVPSSATPRVAQAAGVPMTAAPSPALATYTTQAFVPSPVPQ